MSNGTDDQQYCCAAGVCCGGDDSYLQRDALAKWIDAHTDGPRTSQQIAAAILEGFDLLPKGTIDLTRVLKLARRFPYAS